MLKKTYVNVGRDSQTRDIKKNKTLVRCILNCDEGIMEFFDRCNHFAANILKHSVRASWFTEIFAHITLLYLICTEFCCEPVSHQYT